MNLRGPFYPLDFETIFLEGCHIVLVCGMPFVVDDGDRAMAFSQGLRSLVVHSQLTAKHLFAEIF